MIAAVILAAGQSRRMGRPKMVLPWGEHTVIAQVVSVLAQSGVEEIIVVTGGARQQVEAALSGLPVRAVHNPRCREDHMALSLQVGLEHASGQSEAALVALGDQPQVESAVVRAVLSAFAQTRAPLVVPSFRAQDGRLRRGHPWLVARPLWDEVLALRPPDTLRRILDDHSDRLHYIEVQTGSILRDIDTPEDYRRERPPHA